MVRWRESIEEMAREGVNEFIEFGGKVVAPMVKRITPDASQKSVVSMDDIEAVLQGL